MRVRKCGVGEVNPKTFKFYIIFGRTKNLHLQQVLYFSLNDPYGSDLTDNCAFGDILQKALS